MRAQGGGWERPLLRGPLRHQQCDSWHLRNFLVNICYSQSWFCPKIIIFKTSQPKDHCWQGGSRRSGCWEHFTFGDTLLTQWPVTDKPRSLKGSAWLECLLISSSVRQASSELFFPRKGMSLKEMSRCQAENIANQKTSWCNPNPWLMYFQLNTWNSRPAQGESETSSQVAGRQEGPKWLQKPRKTKDTGLIPSHRMSEPMGHWTSSYFKKNEKKTKEKKGKKKKRKRGEYGNAKGQQCCRAP